MPGQEPDVTPLIRTLCSINSMTVSAPLFFHNVINDSPTFSLFTVSSFFCEYVNLTILLLQKGKAFHLPFAYAFHSSMRS